MTESCTDNGHADGRAILDLHASVGAACFDVTWTNARAEKQRFRRGMSLADLARTLPRMLDEATRRRHNLIVRPVGAERTFIQLDALTADKLPRVAPRCFSCSRLRRAVFRRGWRSPAAWKETSAHA